MTKLKLDPYDIGYKNGYKDGAASRDELLAALKALLAADVYADGEGIVYIEHADTTDGEAAVKQARAAIAEAEGTTELSHIAS